MRKPTLRAQWLGQQLRALREEAGLTLKDIADFLQRNPSTVSRIETADYPIRRPEVLALLDFYDVSDERRRAALIRLSEEVWQKGWWDRYSKDFEQRFVDFVWLEAKADAIRSFDSMVYPGLLQTPEYAEAVIRGADPEASDERIAAAVELRMTRQQVLDRDDPPTLEAVLDEAVLRRQAGSPETSRRQLEHVLATTERPEVNIRVLPLAVGLRPCVRVPFVLFEMAEPYPEVGYVEAMTGALYLEPPETTPLVEAYARLERYALDPDGSARLIADIAKETDRHEHRPDPQRGRAGRRQVADQ